MLVKLLKKGLSLTDTGIVTVFFTALMLERRMHRIDDLSYSLLPIGLILGLFAAIVWDSVAGRFTSRPAE